MPLLETVLAADLERASLMAELETAEPERLGDIYARLNDIDADRAPARAAEILSGLGFTTADLTRPMAEFSGGWRMRVAMAAALFARAGPAAARRADQLSRSGRRAVAGGAAAQISAQRPDHQPRPRAAGPFGRRHPPPHRGPARLLCRRLLQLREATGGEGPAPGRHAGQDGGQEGPHAGLRRPPSAPRPARPRQAQSRMKMIAKLEDSPPAIEEHVAALPAALPAAAPGAAAGAAGGTSRSATTASRS